MINQDICKILRERIINLHYKPGESLNESQLAREFNISRTPIREALIKLSVERLITIIPNSGARVSDINLSDFRELFQLRQILEGGVARLAAEGATEEQIQEIEELYQQILSADQCNISLMEDYDVTFHGMIRKAAHNRILSESLEIVQNQFFRVQKWMAHAPSRLQSDLPDVIQALKERNGSQLEKLMNEHVAHFLRSIWSYDGATRTQGT